ncbi:MAG: hypothetical protein ACLPJH_14740 [Myxococcaceae bacterium]
MRRTLGMAVTLVLLGVVVVSCGSQTITNTPLGFEITEGLLLLSAADPTEGTVVLASNSGNCPAFQAGAGFTQILSSDFLTFALESLSPQLGLLPLSAGTYTINIPSGTGPQDAGLYATSTEYETDEACDFTATGGNSGTIGVQPFPLDAGAGSVATYSVVFGNDLFTGSYPLVTCVIPASAPPILDGGVACLVPGAP